MDYWYLFPLGVAIASMSTSTGIAGSNFWLPLYLLGLQLEPRVAFWAALATMLFGSGSGVVRNLRARTYSGELVGRYFLLAAPAAVAGALFSTVAPVDALLLVFAVFVFLYGAYLVLGWKRASGQPEPAGTGRIHTPLGILAGLLQGTIATGSGVVLLPPILDHEKIRHHAEAVGSTLILVFSLSLLAVSFRVDGALLDTLIEQRGQLTWILVFAVPGAVTGGQLGPRVAQRLPRRYLRLYVGCLLLVVGLLVGARALS